MSAELDDFHMARRKLVLSVAELLAAELRLGDEAANAKAVVDAETTVAFAARDLAESVNALPDGRKPKGWTGAAS